METHLEIGNVKVTVIDPCITEEQKEERRQRIEQSLIRFYKQARKDKENAERKKCSDNVTRQIYTISN